MRISDWSSDVCSSDLLCRNDLDRCQPCRIDSRHQLTHQRRLSRSDIAGDNDKALALRQTIAQIGPLLAVRRAFIFEMRIKIGKASCGERVCPYVRTALDAA